jgi:hypothetical protein
MGSSISLQVINGYLSILAICAFVIFARYIYVKWDQGYWWLRPALALITLWAGEIILRLPIFYGRTLTNSGTPTPFSESSLMLGGFLVGIAFLCCIRVFSEEAWGYLPTVVSIVLSTIVVGFSLLYVYGV